MEITSIPSSQMELVKKNVSYTLVITNSLELEIRKICSEIWEKEWSGILFYQIEGSFATNDLIIKATNLYLMDIGTAGFTSFDMSPDVMSFIMEKNLIGYNMGLIHSHNNMVAFFSSTDINTLNIEGADRDNFVSLIVNNKGVYTAAVTRKKTLKQKVQELAEITNFNGVVETIPDEFEVIETSLEYFMLNVLFEASCDSQSRITELQHKVVPIPVTPSYINPNSHYQGDYQSYWDKKQEIPTFKNEWKSTAIPAKIDSKKESTTQYTWGDDYYGNYVTPKEDILPEKEGKLNDKKHNKLIDLCVLQLLTGSITIPSDSKFSLTKWASNMIQLFDKRFGKDNLGEDKFKIWADSFIEFLCWYSGDDSKELDPEEMAKDIKNKLQSLPVNKYITFYIEILNGYIR